MVRITNGAPAVLQNTHPSAREMTPVIAIEKGRASQKGIANLVTSVAEAYAPIPKGAAAPSVIRPVLKSKLKLSPSMMFTHDIMAR
jgi:hypothetical protein